MSHICFPNQEDSIFNRKYSIFTLCSLTILRKTVSYCKFHNVEHFTVEVQHLRAAVW